MDGSGQRALALAAALVGACREPEPEAEAAAAVEAEAERGDPLLGRARAGIRGGELDPDDEARLLASDDPAHRRARRLFEAMRAAPAPEATERPLAPPKPGPDPDANPIRSPAVAAAGPAEPASSSPAPVAARRRLAQVRLKPARDGVVLALDGTSDLVVGIASQPGSGLVRLVVDGATAEATALRARPGLQGVRVTDVVRGPSSVLITLAVDPGWRVGPIRRVGRGAAVELLRP